MQDFPISTLRIAAAFAALILGMMLSLWLDNLWPYFFPSTQLAFSFIGLCAGLVIAGYGLEGRQRQLCFGVAALTAIAWACCALSDVAAFLAVAFKTIQAWRGAGHGLLKSLKAGFDTFSSFSAQQKLGLQTSLVVGVVPVVVLAFGICDYLLGGRSNSRVSNSGPWTAGWMPKAQVAYLKNLKVGIPLGLQNSALLRYEPNLALKWRGGHHAAIAGTRAGKGVSVVIPAIIDHYGPVVCLDVKGENFAVTRAYRESLGRRVIVLNPFGVIEPVQDSFNPLDYIRVDHLVRDIDVIAEGLVRPERGNGSHFGEMAKQIIAAALEVTFTQNEPQNRNLNSVADILLMPDMEKRLGEWTAKPELYGRRAAQAAATFLSAGENERGGIKTTVKKAFEWARSDEMRAFLTKSTTSLDQLLDDKIDLFIVVPLDQLEAQAVFMRLIINLVLGTVVRQDGKRTVKRRVLLVLDEFVRLGRMEKLLNIANVAAGAGIEALFITQDKGQIEATYGKSDADSLLGSCVTTRIFGLGRAESNTAEWAANALGDQTVLTHSTQSATNSTERARVSTSEHKQKLLTADQILELPADEMLCLIGSKPPLRLKAIVSHEHAAYRGKLGRNPTRQK